MPDLFAPPSGAWQRVSPRLRTAYRLPLLLPAAGLLATGAVLAVADRPAWAALSIVALLGAGAAWRWAARRQRAWGYAETPDELVVVGGVLVRRVVVVPYARLQYVDVAAGPLARALGIATLTLHTASLETAASLPGLPADEARRLRDRLTERGQVRGAGP